jgi:hypothetical protein
MGVAHQRETGRNLPSVGGRKSRKLRQGRVGIRTDPQICTLVKLALPSRKFCSALFLHQPASLINMSISARPPAAWNGPSPSGHGA